MRERLQKVANRLVYGKRATPYEVLSQFSERVAESYAADDVLPRMARVLAEGRAPTERQCGCGAEPSCTRLRPGRKQPSDNGSKPAPVARTMPVSGQ